MRPVLAAILGLILYTAAAPVAAQSPTAPPGGAAASASPTAPAAPIAALEWPAPIAGPGLQARQVVPFADGLVAVGGVASGVDSRAAAWWSSDGGAWERTLLDGRRGGEAAIRWVVQAGSGLVALGHAGRLRCHGRGGEGGGSCDPVPAAVWRSADGRSWQRVPVRAAFAGGSPTGLAAGPLGLLAIGAGTDGVATVWRSADGAAWEATRLTGEGFDRAQLSGVASGPGGWVVVGSVGGHAVTPGGAMEPNGSAGAAWTSTDGVTWAPATVDGSGEQVELRDVLVGAGGLTAVGTLTGGRQAAIWTSSDGTAWALMDPGPDGIVERIPVASDGTVILATSYRFDDDRSLAWWASADGVAWTELAATGETATAPRWDGGVGPEVVRLAAGTLVVLGQDGDREVLWLARLVPELPPSPQVGPATPTASPTAGSLAASDAYWEELAGGDYLGFGPRLEDVIDAADLVVVGRPVGVEPRTRADATDRSRPFDVLHVAVDRVLKGTPRGATEGIVDLVLPRPAGMSDAEVAALLPPGRVVLFLEGLPGFYRRHGRPVAEIAAVRGLYGWLNPTASVLRDIGGYTHTIGGATPGEFPATFQGRPFRDLIRAIAATAR